MSELVINMVQKEYFLAIKDKYSKVEDCETEDFFLSMYKDPNDNDEFRKYLTKIFSVYHAQLNSLISEFNNRVNGTRHYRANESRELISLRDNIFELQEATNNSKYSFWIKYNYFRFLNDSYKFLSAGGGSTIPESMTAVAIEKYSAVFEFRNYSSGAVSPNSNTQEILRIVSTRSAEFDDMSKDEKLSSLNQAIEYLLKDKNNYKQINNAQFCDLINDATVIEFRKKTHCFRHASKESITERQKLTDKQKDFLINFGLSIVTALI